MPDSEPRRHDHPDVEAVHALVVAGWTGRDAAAVDHHVRELAALGVAPPSTIPLFYRASASLLGPHRAIEVVGEETSGEVEPLIVRANGRHWLGVGSDHTDRALEAHSVALSKQICAKPCARELWPLDDVADRLDALELRAWIADAATLDANPGDDDGWTLYQEGTLAAIRPLAELIDASPLADARTSDGPSEGSTVTPPRRDTSAAMLCGTLPAIGGVRAAGAFRFELVDTVHGRALRHAYAVHVLPLVD